MRNRRLFLLIFIFLLPLCGFSQRLQQQQDQQQQTQPDSLYYKTPDSSQVFHFTLNDVCFDSIKQTHIDTTLYRHEIYDPIKRREYPVHHLGNLGLAHQSLVFDIPHKPGFQLGMKGYDGYLFKYNEIPYYELWTPYTKLYYVQGPEEQLFSGDHSQKVMSNLTLGLQFRFIKSLGAYIRQKSNHKSFALKARYHTRDNRYSFLGSYVYNKLDAEENGGIANDSLFTENLEPERNLFQVRLPENKHKARSRVRHAGVHFQQHFFISPRKKGGSKQAGKSPQTAYDTLTGSFGDSLRAANTAIIDTIGDSLYVVKRTISDSVSDSLYIDQTEFANDTLTDSLLVAKPDTTGIIIDTIQITRKTKTDSIKEAPKQKPDKTGLRFSLGKLSHVFNYRRTSHMYWDQDTTQSFYQHFYPDSDNFYDSIYYHKFSNEIAWSNGRIDSAKQALKVRFAMRHDLVKYFSDRGYDSYFDENTQRPTSNLFKSRAKLENDPSNIPTKPDSILIDPDMQFNQFIPSARFRLQLLPHLSILAYGDFVFGEVYNQGDVHLRGKINYSHLFQKGDHLTGQLNLARQEPFWFLHEMYSNHFQWQNNFKKQDIINAGVNYRNKNWYAGLNYHLVNNYAYLGTDTMPHQFSGELSVLRADLRSHHRLGKFTLDNRVIYQQTAQSNIIHFPDLIAKTSLRFNLDLFNGALRTQTGFSLFYTSAYYGDAYVPALNSFHLQEYQETGNHPFADIFINLKIKRTRFFFKMSHVNGGFPEYNYFMSPHYPLRDREFRFGLDWKFYD
ncbi:MAG: putative porin [Bacteroidales bacterium]|nr:putative porin [Bacteroidales bacterium]